jgi:YHS domain-containing protein
MTACPNCQKPVDPLRAPAVSVRDGKVVAFCSKACKEALETKPVKLAPTKVVRLPSNSELVKAVTRTPATGVVTAPAPKSVDSGPIIEVIHDQPSSGAIQIADTGHIDDFVTTDDGRSRRVAVVALLVVLALAGSGVAAYHLGLLDRLLGRGAAPVEPSPTPAEVPPVHDAAAPDVLAPVTPGEALARATAVLREHLQSESPRVQRLAASALARTGDAEALAVLADALATETGDTARLDLAYGLARGGDKRGFDALMAAAAADRRDRKLGAGERLALLGDRKAVQVLGSYLSASQLRLGVAEQLALFAEPRAIAVLEAVRADARAVPDEQARATIALAHAGRADMAPALRAMLDDDRNNAYAAAALAELRDEAARPVLEKQLGVSSLRVGAARALRRLSPEVDVSLLLGVLVAALDGDKDTEQVGIAEAILLLAGPAAWAERA